MKVFELIAQLQQLPAAADVYIGWTEVNDSGTAYDTGTEVSECREDSWGQYVKEKSVVIR